jgi:hypothetical protein
MSAVRHAMELAHIETGGAPDDQVRLKAADRLYSLLSTLDSKTSVLLRFNAIVVAALAYVTVVSGNAPFMGANKALLTIGIWISHASLLASAASCGFAFPVINVERGFLAAGKAPIAGEAPVLAAALERLGRLVERRTWLYSWAWRLAVIGGAGFALLVALATFH